MIEPHILGCQARQGCKKSGDWWKFPISSSKPVKDKKLPKLKRNAEVVVVETPDV
jgi:hypothetical protein